MGENGECLKEVVSVGSGKGNVDYENYMKIRLKTELIENYFCVLITNTTILKMGWPLDERDWRLKEMIKKRC